MCSATTTNNRRPIQMSEDSLASTVDRPTVSPLNQAIPAEAAATPAAARGQPQMTAIFERGDSPLSGARTLRLLVGSVMRGSRNVENCRLRAVHDELRTFHARRNRSGNGKPGIERADVPDDEIRPPLRIRFGKLCQRCSFARREQCAILPTLHPGQPCAPDSRSPVRPQINVSLRRSPSASGSPATGRCSRPATRTGSGKR